MSTIDDIINVVKGGAPLLAKLIPIPGLSIVADLASRFNANPSDPSDIQSKIQADPDAAIKLQQLENEYKQNLATIQLQTQQDVNKTQVSEDQLEIQDTQDAREMAEKEPGQFEKYLASLPLMILSYIIWFGMNYITSNNSTFIYMAFVVCSYWVAWIFKFYFGEFLDFRNILKKVSDKYAK